MGAANSLRPNNTAAILFFMVQVIAFTLFFFDADIVEYTGSFLPLPPTNDYISIPIASAMVAFAGVTFWFMRRFPTPLPGTFRIQFPLVLHSVLLLLEVAYTIYIRGDAGSIEEVRQNLASGESSVGALKLSTAVLYMTTMLLFAKLASPKEAASPARNGETTKLWLVASATVMLFLLKDLVMGSRGSTLNVLCFAAAGWTFVRPVTVRSLFKLRVLAAATVIFALAVILFYQLTVLRAAATGLAIVHDTILIKFSSNLTVVHEYLMGTLYASVGHFWSSGWVPASEVSLYQFFPTAPGFINKYLLLDLDFVEGSVYYKIHGEYPFNSISYMLRMFVFGPVLAFPAIWLIIRVYFLIRRLGLNMAFFAYCNLVYFAVQSFSGLPLIEIPFVLMPFLAILFRRNFVRDLAPLPRLLPVGLRTHAV